MGIFSGLMRLGAEPGSYLVSPDRHGRAQIVRNAGWRRPTPGMVRAMSKLRIALALLPRDMSAMMGRMNSAGLALACGLLCAAPQEQAQTAAAEATWPALHAPRRAPCAMEWDDLSPPPCNRAAFETRYVRLSALAVTAPACRFRDGTWARDLDQAVNFLLSRPRPGTTDRPVDAGASARLAQRLMAERNRATAELARDERLVCDDIRDSTRLDHADRMVLALRASR